MLKYEYTVAKFKNQASQASSNYFVSAWQLVTYLIGICNAYSKKGLSRFSGLKWFLHFEDLYNAKGSLQVNKTSKKKLEFKLKAVTNFKATAYFFNSLSFKKNKQKTKQKIETLQ